MHTFGGRRFVGAVATNVKNGCDKAQPSEAMSKILMGYLRDATDHNL